ncbi:helix-turn-helix domain-containing protein [Stappia sp. GBMRC 2046]|uniref:Helix-turn-helix domain-containing protein n=1 Tax=Stappia sediminis TaxID=2692190 RepID=A0A7X3LR82_9HYPH|nr:helix-turn-helix transcriptional regulator [Stappia sediminis]MXN63603.1 helix-turn-helix domain-containing protein [Stappia sediminis]
MSNVKQETQVDLSNLDLSADQVAEIVGTSVDEVRVADATIRYVQRNADLIKAMREARGLSRSELAEILGLTPGRVSQLESGQIRHAPNLKTLAEIAYRLDFEIDVSAHSKPPETEPYSTPDELVSAELPRKERKAAYRAS